MSLILLTQWVLGLVSGAGLGMWIHLMLVLALLSFVLALIGGRIAPLHRARTGRSSIAGTGGG